MANKAQHAAKQPEALRLADLLEVNHHEPLVERAAAAELRRLHEVNAELLAALHVAEESVGDLKALEIVRAAIAKATGVQQ